MCKHKWEPVYKERGYKRKKYFLYGICVKCKWVVSGEDLMRRLNIYEENSNGSNRNS